AVDRAVGDLYSRLRHSRPRFNAGATGRLEKRGAHPPEHIQVALLLAVAFHVLRAALNEEAHPRRDTLTASRGFGEHARVHVHVFFFARRAGARVRDVHLDPLRDAIDVEPVPGVAGKGDHRANARRVDLDDLAVLGSGVTREAGTQALRISAGHLPIVHQVFDRLGVRRDIARKPTHLG